MAELKHIIERNALDGHAGPQFIVSNEPGERNRFVGAVFGNDPPLRSVYANKGNETTLLSGLGVLDKLWAIHGRAVLRNVG